MGFDKNSSRPLVIWRKWTTEINLGMVIAVFVFFVAGALLIFFWERKSAAAAPAPSGDSTGK